MYSEALSFYIKVSKRFKRYDSLAQKTQKFTIGVICWNTLGTQNA